ncbi:hypothetical protein ABFS83_05G079500 [Erythranthe nasuta]
MALTRLHVEILSIPISFASSSSPFALSVYVYDLDCFFYHCISRWRVVLSSVFSLSSTGSTLDGGRTIKSTATGSGLDDDSPNFWNLNDDSTI